MDILDGKLSEKICIYMQINAETFEAVILSFFRVRVQKLTFLPLCSFYFETPTQTCDTLVFGTLTLGLRDYS